MEVDLEAAATFCNPACLRALAYERVDELIGKNMHELIHHTRAERDIIASGRVSNFQGISNRRRSPR